VILILTLTRSKNSRDIGALVEVNPHAAHGVVHARENLHWRIAWIVTNELLVNLENAFQLAVERLAVDVCDIEIYHRLPIDTEAVLVDNFVDGAGSHIARNQISVLRIPLFQKIPAFANRNGFGIALVARSLRHPNPPAFSASRLRHQTQLV